MHSMFLQVRAGKNLQGRWSGSGCVGRNLESIVKLSMTIEGAPFFIVLSDMASCVVIIAEWAKERS